jgi:transcriptional regulator with XRE-family HTH domain
VIDDRLDAIAVPCVARRPTSGRRIDSDQFALLAWAAKSDTLIISAMFIEHLKSYLRTFRRRTGLSQDEIAFLLCGECDPERSRKACPATSTTVSRHERGEQRPCLEILIAYEIILGTQLSTIYPEWYAALHQRVRSRAAALLSELLEMPPSPRQKQKVEAIRRITEVSNSPEA